MELEKTTQSTHTGASDEQQLLQRLQEGYQKLKGQIHQAVIGQDEVIDAVLCCILSGGHCIVQGVPGLAKTLLVHSLSEALDLTFNRIQFTPDLMPSDITGTDIIEEDRQTGRRSYRFLKGPIFANVVLADEINRTPPKTQAALLQAMQERELTIAGSTYQLDAPFFVLATQNPIEQEGTYSLPEAALDRFMFMVLIQYPEAKDEYQIVKKTTTGKKHAISPTLSSEDILLFQDIVRMAPVSDRIIKYAVDIARATRPGDDLASETVNRYLKWGCGPRAGQYMTLGAKSRALIKNRITPSYEDVQKVAKLVLRHRIIVNFNAEADGVSPDQIIDDILKHVPLPK
ncbi:MAG: MoxR family ATPase [Phycisphaerae bacterium]|nr:MoxR family ATPase [Phycisphaerae bacterium]